MFYLVVDAYSMYLSLRKEFFFKKSLPYIFSKTWKNHKKSKQNYRKGRLVKIKMKNTSALENILFNSMWQLIIIAIEKVTFESISKVVIVN